MASVEGAILVVDATQGIEAQTLSNVYMAIENDLDIIPIINKIDLPAADVEKVAKEVMQLLGCKREEIIPISAKTGQNVEAVLDAVIEKVKEPKVFHKEGVSSHNQELKALVFDSQYDTYRGVVSYVKIFSGEVRK